MLKAAMLTVLGCLAGMATSVANAQYYYSPVAYSVSPIVRPVYTAPVPVGLSYYAPAPVVVARPVYAPVVTSVVYSAPVTTYVAPAPTITYASYEPAPIAIDPVVVAPTPVYVAPAPVVVTTPVYSPAVVRESFTVRPFSSVYRSSTYGWGSGVHVYERSTPFRTVTRIRGW